MTSHSRHRRASVEVQCALPAGYLIFDLLGLAAKRVSEAREKGARRPLARWRCLASKRITLNSPADLPKGQPF